MARLTSKDTKMAGNNRGFVIAVVLVCAMVVVTSLFSSINLSCMLQGQMVASSPENAVTTSMSSNDRPVFDWEANSRRVKEWRSKLMKELETESSTVAGGSDSEEAKKDRHQRVASHTMDQKTVFPCENVLLDFGANVGDTMRKLIDSGLPPINGHQFEYDPKVGGIGTVRYGQKVGRRYFRESFVLSRYIQHKSNGAMPEDFCYYGIEGNPTFTALLKELEITTMNLDPRPLRHLHFFTDHVGTGKDGPTTLYLDTVNKNDHFWGSSIYDSHKDVQRSGGNTGVPVTGITLTTLLRNTLKPNGLAIIKIDIEGAEYPLMEEAVKSGVLCEFCKEKNATISLVLEEHGHLLKGDAAENWKKMNGNEKVRECGVDLNLGDMDLGT